MHRRVGIWIASAWIVAAVGTGSGQADDWPQYRGPERNGIAGETGLATGWGDGGPTVRWHREIGYGFSSVAVAAGRLYTMEAVDLEEAVLAIDAGTGKTVWRHVVGETDPEFFPETGPRSTPTIVDGVVYAASSRSKLLALAADSGELVWERDLTEFGPTPRFGYSMSPLVDGDNVIVLVGDREKQPGILSLDRTTGEERWRALDGPAGYSSPIAVEIGGVRQYVFSTGVGITGMTPDGERLWDHPTGPKAALPMPVLGPPDRIFVATADDHFGGMMIRVVSEDGAFRTEELWTERLMRNHFNTSVIVDDHLYGFDNATFRCLDATTGEKKWAMRGFGKGSIVAAGGRLYVLSDSGVLALVHADPEGYSEAGRMKVTEGRSWTAPSLANGYLYVRDGDELVSLDLRAGDSSAVATTAAADGDPETLTRVTFGPDGLTAEQVIEKHIAARGGAERWSEVSSLRFTGVYSAFSEESPFELVRLRGDRYRLDFEMLGGPAIRARDAQTAWWRHALLQPEPVPVGEHPYRAQLERESVFGPLLLGWAERGLEVTLSGQSEVNGIATIDLDVTLPDGGKETWHLDAQTFLEVAVDSSIYDFTQFEGPTAQRAFYSDFREVDGLVLPFRIDTEFGARLEEMRVDSVEVGIAVDPARVAAPPPPPATEEVGSTDEER